MTIEEITNRQGEIEQRKAEIDAALETPEADLDALGEEARRLAEESVQLKTQLEELMNQAAREAEARKAVAEGAGETKETFTEEKKMTNLEVRGSAEYAEAFKNYIITGSDKECRSLLTENVSGDVPVPVLVEGIIKTAWENNTFLAKVRKTAFRGKLKVP